jgi:hypothetical protein
MTEAKRSHRGHGGHAERHTHPFGMSVRSSCLFRVHVGILAWLAYELLAQTCDISDMNYSRQPPRASTWVSTDDIPVRAEYAQFRAPLWRCGEGPVLGVDL